MQLSCVYLSQLLEVFEVISVTTQQTIHFQNATESSYLLNSEVTS